MSRPVFLSSMRRPRRFCADAKQGEEDFVPQDAASGPLVHLQARREIAGERIELSAARNMGGKTAGGSI